MEQLYSGLKVRVQLVREGSAQKYHKPIACSVDVVEFVGDRLAGMDREYFLSILFNGKNVPIAVEEVSIGSQTASLVHPRELFKSALLASAAGMILAHNHPSGDPSPSREDLELTERIKDAGKLLGITVLDHVIIGHGAHYSFADQGQI